MADLTPEVAPAIVQTSAPEPTQEMYLSAMNALAAQFGKPMADILDRLGRIEDNNRASFELPGVSADPVNKGTRGKWMQTTIRLMSGDRVPETEYRDLADLITGDNLGVVPPNYSSEMIGIIDPARPFLQTTRQMDPGDSGMKQILPKIVTRPTVGVQDPEKEAITSTATSITTEDYDAITIAGGGDLSIQILKRSSPSFLALYLELLAEAYAIKSDDLAVDALLAEAAVNEGGELDPEDASLGAAWANGAAVSRRLLPDHIWLSSAAVARFIDAKANGTNAPLWSNIAANFTAAGGVGGTISGLIPVHVPALDDEAVDIIVGPRNGFVWAEDGTYNLQVDNPAKAGRDVALVGMIWYMPIYPAAFTTFTLTAS